MIYFCYGNFSNIMTTFKTLILLPDFFSMDPGLGVFCPRVGYAVLLRYFVS